MLSQGFLLVNRGHNTPSQCSSNLRIPNYLVLFLTALRYFFCLPLALFQGFITELNEEEVEKWDYAILSELKVPMSLVNSSCLYYESS